MAKSSFMDPDFSLLKGSEARRSDERIKEDIRRHRIQLEDPNAAVRTPWKVSSPATPAADRWKVQEASFGKPGRFTEQVPPDRSTWFIESANGPKNLSVFTLEILTPCGIGGGHVTEAGDIVQCYGTTALDLFGRSKVLEEIRPA